MNTNCETVNSKKKKLKFRVQLICFPITSSTSEHSFSAFKELFYERKMLERLFMWYQHKVAV